MILKKDIMIAGVYNHPTNNETNNIYFYFIFFLSACDKDDSSGEPDYPTFAFQLINENGDDFFSSNELYDSETTEILDYGANNVKNTFIAGEVFKYNDNTTIFGIEFIRRNLYFDYGNNDIDTLEVQAELSDNGGVLFVEYCLNGRSCVEFDFENNSELRPHLTGHYILLQESQFDSSDFPITQLIKFNP